MTAQHSRLIRSARLAGPMMPLLLVSTVVAQDFAPPLIYRLGLGISNISYFDPLAMTPGHMVYGVRVQSVEPGSPEFFAGLKPGDILVRINGSPVQSYQQVWAAVNASGGNVWLRLKDGQTGQYRDTYPFALTASTTVNPNIVPTRAPALTETQATLPNNPPPPNTVGGSPGTQP